MACAPWLGLPVPNCTPPSNGLCTKKLSGLAYTTPVIELPEILMMPVVLATNLMEAGLGTEDITCGPVPNW